MEHMEVGRPTFWSQFSLSTLLRWDLLFLCPWSSSGSLFSTYNLAIGALGLQMHAIVSSFWWILTTELRSQGFCGKWFYSPRNSPKSQASSERFPLYLGLLVDFSLPPLPIPPLLTIYKHHDYQQMLGVTHISRVYDGIRYNVGVTHISRAHDEIRHDGRNVSKVPGPTSRM